MRLIARVCLALVLLLGALPVRAGDPSPRLVSLAPNLTELVFDLGFERFLVGRSSACDYPPEAARLPVAGDFGKPALEPLLLLQPTALLVSDVESRAALEGIRGRGINVLSLPCENWSQLAEAAVRIAERCGDEARGREWAARLTNRVAAIARDTSLPAKRRPSVYVEIWGDPLTTAGRGSFLSELIQTAGGRNMGDALEGRYVAVNPEWVLGAPPDVLLLGYMPASAAPDNARLANRIGWDRMPALRAGRVIRDIPVDLLLRPGPRLLDGCERLAKELRRIPVGGE